MNKILLVGNGFDLAHGLSTSYDDFLCLIQGWKCFKIDYDEKIQDSVFAKYLVDAENLDNQKIEKLDKIIKGNSWIHYFCNCGAEIDGWIDFEKEIYPVIDLFKDILNGERIGGGAKYHLAKLFPKYVKASGTVGVTEEYKRQEYFLKEKTLLRDLKKEFDEFIYAFEIYLHEFVYKKKDIKLLKQIKDINADYVISFNYTLTEKLYGISEQKTHHIHGSIRDDSEQRNSNMVLGINEQEDQNLDFIYFVKYFQRIQKRTGTAYTSYINLCLNGVMEEYELHIYGHSLDITDKDILLYTMENACKIYIYYYDQEDFEHKVINLINLFGREKTEENIQSKHFDFIETNDEIIVE